MDNIGKRKDFDGILLNIFADGIRPEYDPKKAKKEFKNITKAGLFKNRDGRGIRISFALREPLQHVPGAPTKSERVAAYHENNSEEDILENIEKSIWVNADENFIAEDDDESIIMPKQEKLENFGYKWFKG